MKPYIIDLHDYITMHRKQFPELDNFLGFQVGEDADMALDDSSAPKLFEPHFSFEELILGVKEGRYF